MQAPETIQNPGKPIEVQEYARAASKVINGELSFGDPTDRTGAGGANGKKDNMSGSWVTAIIIEGSWRVVGVAAGNTYTFQHNLNAPIQGCGTSNPNVTWEIKGYKSAFVLGAGGPISLAFQAGDAIGANSIELRPIAGDAAPAPNATLVVWFQVVSPW